MLTNVSNKKFWDEYLEKDKKRNEAFYEFLKTQRKWTKFIF